MFKKLIFIILFLNISNAFALSIMRVTGRIYGPDGIGVRDARVALVNTDLDEVKKHRPIWVKTGADGLYELTTEFPGNYVVIVNEGGDPSPDEPYFRHYYTGTNARIPGISLKLVDGTEINNINIRLDEIFEVVTVSGRALYTDGESIGDVLSYSSVLPGEMFRDWGGLKLDAKGYFTLRILKGAQINITPSYFYACCRVRQCSPEFTDKATTTRNSRFLTKQATDYVTANKNITGWEIRLPFKNCGKKITVFKKS